MQFEGVLADALYLNWALPSAGLPAPPPGLRHELVGFGPEATAFFSLVLFRQLDLRTAWSRWVGLSYPQCNARLYARDEAGVPSVWLLRQLTPAWVVPLGRLVARQPLSAAICNFPRLDQQPDGPWRWRLDAGAGLDLTARPGSFAGTGPALGDWPETVAFFRERRRAYWRAGAGLQRAETDHGRVAALPVAVELTDCSWLEARFSFAPREGWRTLHSAFLVPRVELAFALARETELATGRQVPAAG